jgi:tryptophanyl-tRNA synthetase
MRATTDSQPAVDFENLSPGVLNLIDISKGFMGWGAQQAYTEFNGLRYGDLKKKVADIVVSHLEPLQKRYAEIMDEPGYLAGVLKEGAERVSPIAKSTVQLVKERMGLY